MKALKIAYRVLVWTVRVLALLFIGYVCFIGLVCFRYGDGPYPSWVP
jgi:hypothetical protein